MRIFIDTNIVIELLADRKEAETISCILDEAQKQQWSLVLSVGSFYTITFLTERILHQKGFIRPQLISEQRRILLQLLDNFEISYCSSEILRRGVEDQAFADLEDSYQYECASEEKCDVLLTLNLKDFEGVSNDKNNIRILSPSQFISLYL